MPAWYQVCMKITHASHLSDSELAAAASRLAHGEREATVALIVHLAEFDARRLYEPAGFSSLFKYCRAKPTVENIQLRCRAHNGYEVDLFFGKGKRRTRSDVVREGRSVYVINTSGTRPGTSTRSRMNEFIAAAIRRGP